MSGSAPLQGGSAGGGFSLHAKITGEDSTNLSLPAFFFFFFKVEISSCALIPLFRLGISPQWLSELR